MTARTAPGTPEGACCLARIPDHLIEDALESAEECPGECIIIEPILVPFSPEPEVV